MKFTAWVFVALGAVTGLASVEGFLEGDRPYGVAVLAVVALLLGLRFLTWGKDSVSPLDAGQETVELPLSPNAALVIGARPRKYVRRMAIVLPVVIVLIFVVTFLVTRSGLTLSAPDPWAPVIGAGAVGGSLVLMVLLVWVFATWLPARRDLREAKYLRTTGPIAIARTRNGYLLRMADRSMFVGHRAGGEIEKHGLKWAVVDYTRHTHIILGVWNDKGQTVFLAEGYRASPPAVGSQN